MQPRTNLPYRAFAATHRQVANGLFKVFFVSATLLCAAQVASSEFVMMQLQAQQALGTENFGKWQSLNRVGNGGWGLAVGVLVSFYFGKLKKKD